MRRALGLGLALGACAGPLPEAQPAPGILLVSMDTVRLDRTSLVAERDTTPNLRRLAQQGVWFAGAHSVANESITSHAAVFTGRYPSEIATPDYARFGLPPGTPTLASILGQHGVATAAFTGGGHVSGDFGLDEGFGRFFEAGQDGGFASFFDTVPPALDWIGAQTQPWFAVVHGYDAHTPYVQSGPLRHPFGTRGATPQVEELVADSLHLEQLRGPLWFVDRTPQDFVHASGRSLLGTDFYRLDATPSPGERVVQLSPAELAHIGDHYDAGLAYADLWLGVLLAGVDLERTLVIVISDHGEDLLDHGYINHRAGLWDSSLAVPLVVAGPGFAPGTVHDGLLDLRSIAPTVLAHLDLAPATGMAAAPLQTAPGAEVVFAEGVMDQLSARSAAGRLVLHGVGLVQGTPGLGARGLLGEGVERHPVAGGAAPDDVAAQGLLDALVAWRKGLRTAQTGGEPIDPAVREELGRRGYWVPATPGEPGAAH